MIKDVPYFPLYAANILASKPFRLMTLEERGLWITIQMECWVNGSVPSEISPLAKYLGVSDEQVKRSLTQVQSSFLKQKQNEFVSTELEGYRAKYLDARAKQVEGGKKGAERKKAKNEAMERETLQGIPEGQPRGSLIQLNSNSLTSTSINSTSLLGNEFISNEEWLNDYENASISPVGYLKASRG